MGNDFLFTKMLFIAEIQKYLLRVLYGFTFEEK